MKKPFIPDLDYLSILRYDPDTGIIKDSNTNEEIRFLINENGEKVTDAYDPDDPLVNRMITYARLALFAHGLDISEFKIYHINGDKLDNRLDNLLVLTSHEFAHLTTIFHGGKRRIFGYKKPKMGNPFEVNKQSDQEDFK